MPSAAVISTNIYQYGIGNLKKWRFLPERSREKNGVNAWLASLVVTVWLKRIKPLGEINKLNRVVRIKLFTDICIEMRIV